MTPYYADESVTLYAGDALDVLHTLPDQSVDAVVTDPPYSLRFMGAKWDSHETPFGFQQWCEQWATEALRVLRPGGHIAAFGGTRTYHRLACGIEDAGFEIRDSIGCGTGTLAWIHGQGFPKSSNVSADPRFCQCLPDMRDVATEKAAESAAQLLLDELRRSGEAEFAGLASLHGVRVDLHPDYSGAGSPQQDLLGAVRGPLHERGEEGPAVAARPAGDGSLRKMFTAGEALPQPAPAVGGDVLLASVPGAGSSADAAGERLRRDGHEAEAPLRPGESGLEGRGDLQAAEGQLHRPEVRAVPTRVAVDGTDRRLRHGAPAGDGAVDRPPADAVGVRQPHQPQPARQPAGEPGPLADERRPQARRGWPLCPGCGKPRIPAGLGTALKPAWEPIVLARKPLEGTVAGNVTRWGTGALNIAACRVGDEVRTATPLNTGTLRLHGCSSIEELRALAEAGAPCPDGRDARATLARAESFNDASEARTYTGRWPTNALLDTAAAQQLDRETPNASTNAPARWVGGTAPGTFGNVGNAEPGSIRGGYGDTGGASRFFPTFAPPDPLPAWRYEPKAPTFERPKVKADGGGYGQQNYGGYDTRECNVCGSRRNDGNLGEPACGHGDWKWAEQVDRQPDTVAHPTVKPLDLIRWLCRLITPPGGLILDCFAGSGTTGEAAVVEGFRAILVEREAAYLPLIVARLSKPIQPDLFGGVA